MSRAVCELSHAHKHHVPLKVNVTVPPAENTSGMMSRNSVLDVPEEMAERFWPDHDLPVVCEHVNTRDHCNSPVDDGTDKAKGPDTEQQQPDISSLPTKQRKDGKCYIDCTASLTDEEEDKL